MVNITVRNQSVSIFAYVPYDNTATKDEILLILLRVLLNEPEVLEILNPVL